MNQVARVALGEKIEIHHAPSPKTVPMTQEKKFKNLREWNLPLRNMTVSLFLPFDLTMEEAEKLCSFILLLPSTKEDRK